MSESGAVDMRRAFSLASSRYHFAEGTGQDPGRYVRSEGPSLLGKAASKFPEQGKSDPAGSDARACMSQIVKRKIKNQPLAKEHKCLNPSAARMLCWPMTL